MFVSIGMMHSKWALAALIVSIVEDVAAAAAAAAAAVGSAIAIGAILVSIVIFVSKIRNGIQHAIPPTKTHGRGTVPRANFYPRVIYETFVDGISTPVGAAVIIGILVCVFFRFCTFLTFGGAKAHFVSAVSMAIECHDDTIVAAKVFTLTVASVAAFVAICIGVVRVGQIVFSSTGNIDPLSQFDYESGLSFADDFDDTWRVEYESDAPPSSFKIRAIVALSRTFRAFESITCLTIDSTFADDQDDTSYVCLSQASTYVDNSSSKAVIDAFPSCYYYNMLERMIMREMVVHWQGSGRRFRRDPELLSNLNSQWSEFHGLSDCSRNSSSVTFGDDVFVPCHICPIEKRERGELWAHISVNTRWPRPNEDDESVPILSLPKRLDFDRINYASKVIQQEFRHHLAKKEIFDAVAKIQAQVRGWIVQRKDKAAVTIQYTWRERCHRVIGTKCRRLADRAVVIQRAWRWPRQWKKRQVVIASIKAMLDSEMRAKKRALQCHKKIALQKAALQQCLKDNKEPAETFCPVPLIFKEEKVSGRERLRRKRHSRRKVKKEPFCPTLAVINEHDETALAIQKAWRCFELRRHIEMSAYIVWVVKGVQSIWRGRVARRAIRYLMLVKRAHTLLKKEDDAATAIQSFWRSRAGTDSFPSLADEQDNVLNALVEIKGGKYKGRYATVVKTLPKTIEVRLEGKDQTIRILHASLHGKEKLPSRPDTVPLRRSVRLEEKAAREPLRRSPRLAAKHQ